MNLRPFGVISTFAGAAIKALAGKGKFMDLMKQDKAEAQVSDLAEAVASHKRQAAAAFIRARVAAAVRSIPRPNRAVRRRLAHRARRLEMQQNSRLMNRGV